MTDVPRDVQDRIALLVEQRDAARAEVATMRGEIRAYREALGLDTTEAPADEQPR